MSIAIDANVLIYRTNRASSNHIRAVEAFDRLLANDEVVYLFWPVLVAYVRVVTIPGVLRPPLALREALDNVAALLTAPTVRVAAERERFWDVLDGVSSAAGARGSFIHDAHLVALMRQNDVGTIWTNDRGFLRFRGIQVVDPFA